MGFRKATKEQAKARAALIGPPGSGKTYTALTLARAIAGGGRIALIDTENGSASKYADLFDFDTQSLESFTPQSYMKAIREAEDGGYPVCVIDSLSHGWTGKDGVLAMVDNATSRAKSGNAFATGWREVTPQHNALVDALVRCKCHLIVTMRVKTEYIIEEINGKKVPRKVGLAPVQREGLEYEFDVVGDMDIDHKLVITKSRCPKLSDQVFHKPGDEVGQTLKAWLEDGTAPAVVTAHPLADPAVFGELLDDAFRSRQFQPEEADRAVAAAIRGMKVQRLSDLTNENRQKFLEAVMRGDADKHKVSANNGAEKVTANA